MPGKTGHVYGLHAVTSLLARRPGDVTGLLLAEGAAEQRLAPLLEAAAAA
jgi:tRNA G18 (ribose-2'-O)-methylase SpoU